MATGRRCATLPAGAVLLALALPALVAAHGVTDAALVALRDAVQSRVRALETSPDPAPGARRTLRGLRKADRLLRRTGIGEHASDARLLAGAVRALAAVVPAGTDGALDFLLGQVVDALLAEGVDSMRAARDLADYVPDPRGRVRVGHLVDQSAARFAAAELKRSRGRFAGALRAAAQGQHLCDRAARLAERLGSPGRESDLGWLKTNVFTPSCATLSCHSAAAQQGALVLEGDRPFAALVGVAATNPAAAAAGKLRVRAGDPDGSFLYQKLAGTLAAGEGDRMPQVGVPLPEESLLRVRRWIERGALPVGAEDITLPAPASGFQIRIPPFEVPAGKEVQRNYYFKTPNEEPVVATRIEFVYPPGSHHFNVFTSDTEDRPDGTIEEGFNAVPFETWVLRAASQRERLDWTLPPGVGIVFNPRQQLLGQIHFVNAGPQDSPLGGMATVNFHTRAVAEVPFLLGTMFGQNKFIALPPRAESSFDFGTTFANLGVDHAVRVTAVTGHFHWRGKSLEVRLWDGQNPDESGFPLPGEFDRMGAEMTIYRSDDWDEPPFRVFPRAEIEIPVGWGVVYRTTYYNPTDETILFGPEVQTQEHANLFVYFYPGPEDGQTLWYPLPFQSG